MVPELVNLFMAPFLRIDIEQVVAESIDQHEPDMVELNQQQLAKGERADGQPIAPFYKPATVKARKKQGLQTAVVDLKEKENFYKGTFAKRVNKDATEVSSSDRKTPWLVRRYGGTIFGLSVLSKEEFARRMMPTLQTNFKNALQS